MEIAIYTDGASRGNPGNAAIGVIIYDSNGQVLKEDNAAIGIATNNVAEYKAVIRGLELALELKATVVKLYADSQLLVRQLSGEYSVKNEGLKPLYNKVKELTGNFKSLTAIHIPREQNKEADKLANRALDRSSEV